MRAHMLKLTTMLTQAAFTTGTVFSEALHNLPACFIPLMHVFEQWYIALQNIDGDGGGRAAENVLSDGSNKVQTRWNANNKSSF